MVRLSPTLWAKAILLGEARRLSNEKHRLAAAHRGDEDNARIDVLGCMAELLLLGVLERGGASGAVRSSLGDRLLIEAGGGRVKGPDIALEDGHVDIKTYNVRPKPGGFVNRYFAINGKKHDEVSAYANPWYVGVLAREGGSTALISRLFPASEVDGWAVADLRRHAARQKEGGSSPSRNLPIARFLSAHAPAEDALMRLASPMLEPADILNEAGTAHGQLGAAVPALARIIPASRAALVVGSRLS